MSKTLQGTVFKLNQAYSSSESFRKIIYCLFLFRDVPVVSVPVLGTRFTDIFLVSVTRYRPLKKSAKYRRVVSEYLLPGIGRYWYLLFSIGLTKSKIYLLMNPYILHIVVACGLQQTMVVSSLKTICWTMVTIYGRRLGARVVR